MPLHRRLPKRGFINPFRREMAVVNIRDLVRFAAGSVVDPVALKAAGLVPSLRHGVKVLGVGDLDRALTIRAHAVSETARKKVEAAGGRIEIVALTRPAPVGTGSTIAAD
jgi:large subunit ribosomal protein L15